MQHWRFPELPGEERESLGARGGLPSVRFNDQPISFSSNPRWSFMTHRRVYSSGMVLCFFFPPKTFDKNERRLAYSNFLVNDTHTQSTGQEQQKGHGRECIKYHLQGPPCGSEPDLCTPRLDGNNSGSCLPFQGRIAVSTGNLQGQGRAEVPAHSCCTEA